METNVLAILTQHLTQVHAVNRGRGGRGEEEGRERGGRGEGEGRERGGRGEGGVLIAL